MLSRYLTISSAFCFGSVLSQLTRPAESPATAIILGTVTGTASAPAATKTFSVGADGHTFTPHEVTANVGDIIEYRFYPQNHSVVLANFGPEPCIPYELTGAGRVGWWSGWEPVNVVTSDPPIFRIRVNDTNPMFFYCSSPGACFDGMVGVVNPNSTHTFEAQLAYTQNATAALSPGEFFPEEKLDPTSTKSAPKSTSAADDHTSGSHPHSLSAGAIAGIAVGAVVVLALIGLVMYMCGRQRSLKDILHNPTHTGSGGKDDTPVAYQPASPGYSEANYPNMVKSPAVGTVNDSRYSAQTWNGNGVESWRASSPPIGTGDERGMVGVMNGTINHNSVGYMSPGVGWQSQSPSPRYEELHEMDHGVDGAAKSKVPLSPQNEVHELAAPVNQDTGALSPASQFSYTEGETRNTAGHRDSRPVSHI